MFSKQDNFRLGPVETPSGLGRPIKMSAPCFYCRSRQEWGNGAWFVKIVRSYCEVKDSNWQRLLYCFRLAEGSALIRSKYLKLDLRVPDSFFAQKRTLKGRKKRSLKPRTGASDRRLSYGVCDGSRLRHSVTGSQSTNWSKILGRWCCLWHSASDPRFDFPTTKRSLISISQLFAKL